jgi:hypothetical protein
MSKRPHCVFASQCRNDRSDVIAIIYKLFTRSIALTAWINDLENHLYS